MFRKGESVTINGQVSIVTMEGPEIPGDAEDRLGVFFGTFDGERPEFWIVPAEYLIAGPPIVLKH